ncbi:uncharacterized protein PV06_11703 [Exophiala oligosperma]|uniref:GH64 domain-containing protein n=1 Tax=Exophiala oligosperma TaxID=215243 RepID=A0A0D2CY48_9EURO|nr:uncharacterized protein PV06_11703 [Exophiala oligosperma]KIW35983.1 hypothetical protein PV06_11703 [Exophiala oligosperma]
MQQLGIVRILSVVLLSHVKLYLASSRRYDPIRRFVSTIGGPHAGYFVNNTYESNIGLPVATQELELGAQQKSKVVVNNIGNSSEVNMYVTGNDLTNNLVILTPNGQWYYPTVNDSLNVPMKLSSDVITIPVQCTSPAIEVRLPSPVSAGRIWFAHGDLEFSVVRTQTSSASLVQPSLTYANISWDFVEFTTTPEEGLWVNLSFVDFVGIALGLELVNYSPENTTSVPQSALGLQSSAIDTLCRRLADQSIIDGYSWGDLCLRNSDSRPVRVLSPTSYIQANPEAFSDYWTCYIEEVWTRYTSESLTIYPNSQDLGDISCGVQDDLLICTDAKGTVEDFGKPSAKDVFGCNSGPFTITENSSDLSRAVVPRLCAGINRSTLLLDDSSFQPSGIPPRLYYTGNVTNWYSKLVHQLEIDGKGYAFPYDDVSSVDGDSSQSGLLTVPEPWVLSLFVGA